MNVPGRGLVVSKKILVAEDSPTQAEYLRLLLESENFQVELASNGREALGLVQTSPPDLILSDVLMPEVDGYAFCQAVKSSEATQHIPFVLLTQLHTPAGIAVGLQHGADDFVAKPFEERSLLERVRQILESGPSRRENGASEPADLLEKASLLLNERERALRDANEFLEHLIAASPGLIVQGDARNLSLWYASPNIETVLGFTPEEVLRRPDLLLELIHPEDRDRFRCEKERVLEQKQAHWETECRFRCKNGAYRWFYTTLRFDHAGVNDRIPVVASMLDITARKQAEAELQELNETLERRVAERTAAAEERARELARSEEAVRETNETLGALFEAAPLAIIALDGKGNVRMWNGSAERVFGWSEREVLGRPAPLVTIDTQDEHGTLRERVMRGEAFTGVEIRRQTREGKPVDVSLSAGPLRDAKGEISGVMAVLEDVTSRKELEAQLRQSQKMDAIGQMAGGVAHDFNNMLAVITGYSELLLGRDALDEPVRGYLYEINRAGDRAASLTRQLLAFSRRQVLEPKVLDLTEVVESTANMLRRLIGADIHLSTASDPALGRVKADPGQMEQILMNLAVNARDAMPEGGKLKMELRNVELTSDSLGRAIPVDPGRYVLLAVTDTGSGMDQETQSHVFEPFFTTKEEGKGTGLGLATVYGIVKQSGGYIQVDSAPGRGTTFSIYLPEVDEEVTRCSEGVIPADSDLGSETILLVEDDAAVRELIREILQVRGYTILEATNGGEALHFCQRYNGTIHLLLTDVVMPAMSGRELFERMIGMSPDMKVLFVSGHTDDAIDRRGGLTGSAAFIQKPFTPSALARKVREVLG